MSGNPFDESHADNPFAEPTAQPPPIPAQPAAPPAYDSGSSGFKASDVFGDSYGNIGAMPAGATTAPAAATGPNFEPAAEEYSFESQAAPAQQAQSSQAQFVNFEAISAPPPPSSGAPGPADPSAPALGFEGPAVGEAPAPEKPAEPRSWKNFYKPEHYQIYFDVDAPQVLSRMLFGGIFPFGKRGFLEFVHPNPDLYGPFWITTTLVFLLAAVSNFASWIEYWLAGKDKQWKYDFMPVVVGAGVLYIYIVGIPLALWALSKLWLNVKNYDLIDSWCLYGYSLSIYIAVTFFCIIPQNWLRWLLTLLAASISTFSLVWNLVKALRDSTEGKAKVLGTVAVAGGMHVCLGLVYKLYFFRFKVPSSSSTGLD